jgi:hypothetical protein
MKKALIAMVGLGMISSAAYAGCTTSGCTGKVTKLYMTASGTLYVGTDGDEKALNCAGGAGNGGVSGVYMSLKEGDVGKNAMYSLLLTAKTTGKKVRVRVVEGSSDCKVQYVTID